MKRHLICILLVAFGFFDMAIARSMNCGTKVVRIGDTAEHVRTHCGEPAFVERETKLFNNGGTLGERCFHGTVNIERLIYKRAGGIPTIVTVVEGKVERIRPQTGGFESGWRSPCR